jgi:hypothetical protein
MTSQDLTVELYYDGAWQDITADEDVFTAPITIKRGQSDEATQLRPASIALQLNNADDKYRTSNPVSPLYGKAGRNTPVRVTVGDTVRGVVEASSWAADQSQDFRANPKRGKAWVDVDGGGLLQRVGQWTQLVESTMIKGMRSFTTHLMGAWPMEDASGSTILTNITSGGVPGAIEGSVTLGESERPAGSARTLKLGSDGHVYGTCARSAASGWQISFAFKLPAVPGSATYEEIFGWYDSTGRRWSWQVNNANYSFNVIDNDGATVLGSGASSFAGAEPNQWIRAKMKATVSGATVTYEPSWYPEGGGTELGVSGTFSGTTTGYLTRWGITADTYNVDAWYAGVFGIDDATVTLFNPGVLQDFNGHSGETTGARFTRLMGDLGLSYTVVGDSTLSAPMGGQPEASFPDLLQEIVATEDGLIFDSVDAVELTFMLRNARYNQTPAVTLYAADLPGLPVEVTDDLDTHNIVTASQRDGGSVTAEDSTGPLGTLPPPDGAGEYRQTVDVNVADETNDLPQQANWWLRRGTVNLPRYPQVTVNLGALDAATVAAVEGVEVGSVIELPDIRENTVRLYVLGYTETIRPADQGKVRRTIVFTCAPDQQFVVGEYDSTSSRYDLRTSTLNADKDPTTTSMTLKQTDDESWSTTAVPYDIFMAGERITVTAMGSRSGSGPWLQAATVVRSVNGVVKAQTAGAEVHIATPGRWAL